MINEQLLHPGSIVVIGGSNNVHKPGGAIVRNLLNGDYQGDLRIVNPKEDTIQGIKAFHDVKDIPQTDLARRSIVLTMSTTSVQKKASGRLSSSPQVLARRRRLGLNSNSASSTPVNSMGQPS